ncbi:hypothetical protein K9L27_01375 [Candidatus Gracilibacteria bacterium]|nr:hypothetical protein [Candidatus Gracilibacteria bacterium]
MLQNTPDHQSSASIHEALLAFVSEARKNKVDLPNSLVEITTNKVEQSLMSYITTIEYGRDGTDD